MGKLNFCPYDYKKIEMDNLAYELAFAEGWSWERVQRETVVGMDKKLYINEKDRRRGEYVVPGEEPVILLENSTAHRSSGFDLFRRYIQWKSPSMLSADLPNSGNTEEPKGRGLNLAAAPPWVRASAHVDPVPAAEPVDEAEEEEKFGMESRPLRLAYRIKRGRHTFTAEDGENVMYALPCCPWCHRRLPEGWETADDFAAISLVGDEDSGKTAFLYSMMHNRWEALQYTGNLCGRRLTVKSANYDGGLAESIYRRMAEQAEAMCQPGGKCPEPTVSRPQPVFLQVNVRPDSGDGAGCEDLLPSGGGKTLILGIYDTPGQWQPDQNPADRFVLGRSFADICLIDPHKMNLMLPEQRTQAIRQKLGHCQMLTPKEQADLQKKHRGQRIRAEEVLFSDARRSLQETNKGVAVEACRGLWEQRQSAGELEHMKEMYCAVVLAKADLLTQPEAEIMGGYYDILFDPELKIDACDINGQMSRNILTEQMIREHHLLEDSAIAELQRRYGNRLSWHCISALGCDTHMSGTLIGDYQPLHIQEAVMSCIVRRVRDNHWV